MRISPTALRKIVCWVFLVLAAFLVGRRLISGSPDFRVYHTAASSFLEGRTDLYSETFAESPPQIYVYPPLFVMLISPMAWLSVETAAGLWAAALAAALAGLILAVYRRLEPGVRLRWGLAMVFLAGPYVALGISSGNVHLYVVLLLATALLAWVRGRVWVPSIGVALGGAVKLFPLFALVVLIVYREWAIVTRVLAVSVVLWLAPMLWFGPARTIDLYADWYSVVISDVGGFQQARSLDQSLGGVFTRWLSRVDYSTRRDANYPQVTLVELPEALVRALTLLVFGGMAVLSIRAWRRLGAPESRPGRSWRAIGLGAGILVTVQTVSGPYSPILYFSSWMIVALFASPALPRGATARVFVAVSAINTLLFAIPGANSQRALQAFGVYTLVGVVLWAVCLAEGLRPSGGQERIGHPGSFIPSDGSHVRGPRSAARDRVAS